MPLNPIKKLKGIKYTAIDFGHHSLKLLHCRVKGDKIKILQVGKQSLPDNAIKNGSIKDKNMVANQLEKLINNLSLSPGRILFTPAGGQEFVRKLEMPAMSEEELKEALNWEVEEYLDYPPERVSFDFVTLHREESQTYVVLVAIPDEFLDDYKQVFSQISYTPWAAGVEDLALISLLNYQKKLDQPSLIVNMGSARTKIIIASHEDFFISRTINLGGDDFTRLLEDQGMDKKEAEEAKMTYKINAEKEEQESEQPDDIELIMSDMDEDSSTEVEFAGLVDQLAEEINRSIQFFSSQRVGEVPSEMFFTGGGFRMQGLKDYLQSQIDIEMSCINSFSNFNIQSDLGEDEDLMAEAAGLVTGEVLDNEN